MKRLLIIVLLLAACSTPPPPAPAPSPQAEVHGVEKAIGTVRVTEKMVIERDAGTTDGQA